MVAVGATLDTLTRRFPDSRFVYWSYVRYYEEKGVFSAAALWYEKLSRAYRGVALGDFNGLTTALAAAEYYLEMDRYSDAVRVSRSALTTWPKGDEKLCRDLEKTLHRAQRKLR